MATTAQLGITELTEGQSQKEVTINTALETLDKAITGYLVKSVAGSSNVTLNATEWLNTTFEFTGTLTGSISIFVPITTRKFTVFNNTTGSFTVTIAVTGTPGETVLVAQGGVFALISDGTDVRITSGNADSGWEHLGAETGLTTNLEAFWNMNETGNGSRADASGNGNTLIDTSHVVTDRTGLIGNATDFDGTTGYLTIADNASLSMSTTQSFTVTAWVIFDVLAQASIIGKGNGGAQDQVDEFRLTYHSSTNRLRFWVGDGSGGTPGTNYQFAEMVAAISTGVWYFCVGIYNKASNTVSLQVNEGAIASASYSTGSHNSAQELVVGASTIGHGQKLNGGVENVGVWKRVLSATELTFLYNGSASRQLPFGSAGIVSLTDLADNVAIGTQAVGADASNVLSIKVGAAPTTSPTLTTQIYAKERTTNKTGLAVRAEDGSLHILSDRVGLLTQTPSTDVGIGGQSARTVALERHQTADTAGNNLTVQAGGATSGATNKDGGDIVVIPGLGTGNAVPGVIRLQGDAANETSGTSDHAIVDRFIPNGFKVLTDNSAIAIVNVTVASNSGAGGVLHYTIEVTDGTDFQIETGSVLYSVVNKAGAFTVTINEINSQQAVSAGTLTTAWALSSANPAVLSVNADTSLTPSTGYPRITFSVSNLTQQAIALA